MILLIPSLNYFNSGCNRRTVKEERKCSRPGCLKTGPSRVMAKLAAFRREGLLSFARVTSSFHHLGINISAPKVDSGGLLLPCGCQTGPPLLPRPPKFSCETTVKAFVLQTSLTRQKTSLVTHARLCRISHRSDALSPYGACFSLSPSSV